VTEDRERIPIAWLSGVAGDGTKGDYYVLPSSTQLDALAGLVQWLTGSVTSGAAIGAQPIWRQFMDHPTDPSRKLFAMTFNPQMENAVSTGGVMPHILFRDPKKPGAHFDGSVPGLFTWLVIDRGMGSVDAYSTMKTLISDPSAHVSVGIKIGGSTTTVHCLDVTSFMGVLV
jgi:hypothetical protein